MVRIGTSGIVVPGSKETFPEGFKSGSRLHYYGSLFNSIEINSSFHKVPLPKTFEKWRNEVSEDFTFTLKVWREITHVKNLLYSRENVEKFMTAADNLADKKACLLVQFPGKISLGYFRQVNNLLTDIQSYNRDNKWKIAVEFRSSSWYCSETYEMLSDYAGSLVFHDIAASRTPLDTKGLPFIYLRFHGPTGNYRGSYETAVLEEYGQRISNWENEGKKVYVYFNNTMGAAYDNAAELKRFLNKRKEMTKI